MLTPDELLHISEGGEEIAEQLHNAIIQEIISRIAARVTAGSSYILTATDKWRIEVLQDAGYLREDIAKEIARLSRLELAEIREAFEDAGVKVFNYDTQIYRDAGLISEPVLLAGSPQYIRLLQRAYEATQNTWQNYTGTFADAAQQLFIRECDKAYNLVSTGAMSYAQAYSGAINTIAADGVTVTYPSGHSDTIETATLRCIRTGISQACADITNARMNEMGWDIVLVSAHLGARTGAGVEDFRNHHWWQGKFYSKSGTDPRFPPFSVCGQGDVQGINGANCRHSYGPGDGIHNPFDRFDSEDNQKMYDLQQRQRLLERRIRKTKRECMAWKSGVDNAPDAPSRKDAETGYKRAVKKLKRQNEEYNTFCADNGLKRLSERIQIAQWDRKQAMAAQRVLEK